MTLSMGLTISSKLEVVIIVVLRVSVCVPLPYLNEPLTICPPNDALICFPTFALAHVCPLSLPITATFVLRPNLDLNSPQLFSLFLNKCDDVT